MVNDSRVAQAALLLARVCTVTSKSSWIWSDPPAAHDTMDVPFIATETSVDACVVAGVSRKTRETA